MVKSVDYKGIIMLVKGFDFKYWLKILYYI